MKNRKSLLTGLAVAFALCAVVAGNEAGDGFLGGFGFLNVFAAETGNDNVTETGNDVVDTEDEISKDIEEILQNPENVSVDKIEDIVAQVGGMDKLAEALNNDAPGVLEQVTKLEQMVMQKSNITVEKPAVSADAEKLVQKDQISVLGAALNANQANDTVKLSLDVKETPAEVASSLSKVGATNVVTLDLKLLVTASGASDAQEVHSLKAPIHICMPKPAGLSGDIVIFHQKADESIETIYPQNLDGNMIAFTVKSFSNFVFAQLPGTAENKPSTDDKPSTGDKPSTEDKPEAEGSYSAEDTQTFGDVMSQVEDMIASAAAGSTVEITKDMGINCLSNSQMQALVKRGNVTLKMQYIYKDKEYTIVIPAGCAENNSIEWYGPLYLAAHYSGNVVPAKTVVAGDTYQVQKGDTLSKIAAKFGTTVNVLKSLNSQIQDVNKIYPGWKLIVK